MEDKLVKVKEILKKYNQEHLISFYNELIPEEQEKLLNQILEIDFDLMQKLYETTKQNNEVDKNKIEPIEYSVKDKLTEEEFIKYTNLGIEAIKNGKIAVCQMAGGQRN